MSEEPSWLLYLERYSEDGYISLASCLGSISKRRLREGLDRDGHNWPISWMLLTHRRVFCREK